ncbi:MAG: hypothetical protein Q7V53_02745 [Caldisericota bacterium]|nr:hypothetical protein [Caldisericota bacterium]
MLLPWLLSDSWTMTLPARVADTLVCAIALWLASHWCRSRDRSFGKAFLASAISGAGGIGLYAAFVWARDTGVLPWQGPLWLVINFLAVQTVFFAFVALVTHRREGWRSVNIMVVTLILAAALEAGLFLLLAFLLQPRG